MISSGMSVRRHVDAISMARLSGLVADEHRDGLSAKERRVGESLRNDVDGVDKPKDQAPRRRSRCLESRRRGRRGDRMVVAGKDVHVCRRVRLEAGCPSVWWRAVRATTARDYPWSITAF